MPLSRALQYPRCSLGPCGVSRADFTGSRISHSGFLLTQFHYNIVSQQQDAAQERRFALAEVC